MLALAAVLVLNAALGVLLSRWFSVFSLLLTTPVMAVIAAVVLKLAGFGFAAGILGITAALVVCQASYLAGCLLRAGVGRPALSPGMR